MVTNTKAQLKAGPALPKLLAERCGGDMVRFAAEYWEWMSFLHKPDNMGDDVSYLRYEPPIYLEQVFARLSQSP